MTTPETALAPETIDGAELLDQVRAALTRYVVLPSAESVDAVVLWIAATHAVPCWAHAARLVIRAPEKRCGKSRLLDLIEALCHQPLITVNASTAAVYRAIGLAPDDPPTLLIDEADTIFGPKAGESNEELRGLLNAGHQRNRPTIRWNAAAHRVESIATFAMAALAGIGAMPDTIEDRAVVIRMRRRAPGEAVAPYRTRRDAPALRDLAGRLNTWLTARANDLAAAAPAMPVEDRAADTWEPLIAVADLAGHDWPTRARTAVIVLTADRDSAAEVPLKVRLLMDCRTAFADATALPTETLLSRLKDDPEAPWDDLGANGLTARRLSALLREYDITSHNIRLPTGQAKGYSRSDFTDAWNRYCPAPDPAGDQVSYPTDKVDDQADDPVTAPPGTKATTDPELFGVPDPSQASQASQPRSARDGKPGWDGSSVPPLQSVPGLTSDGTLGTGGTPTPPPPVCIRCRQPLAYDDGTHTHPACETA